MSTAVGRSIHERGQGTAAEALRAPLLEALLTRIRQRERQIVLDLGPARSKTLAFFAGGRHKLIIADVIDALTSRQEDEAGSPVSIPAPTGEPVDLVLLWDLPNYLSRQAFSALMEQMVGYCGGDTRIHCMVAYSAPRIPALPAAHCLLPDAGISRQAVSAETVDAPRYPLGDMDRLLPQYAMERSVLMRNGLQECLLYCREGPRE